MLGRFRAELAAVPVPEDAWRGGRAKAVVKVLALAPDHCLHREQVMDALWPDLAPEAAGANLRKAVHYARRATSPRSVLSHGEVLVADAWVDVDAFEAAADVGDVPAALELYTGELLPEDRFAPWAEERRRRLQERCAQLLQARASELAADGEPGSAAELLERAIGLDPLDERAVGKLMRCYAAAGRRHLALARYGELQARLVADLGVSPGPDLQRLRAQLASGRVAAAGPVRRAATLPLDERKVLTVALVDASARAEDPELMRREQDAWVRRVTEIVEAWGGSAYRLVGASLVAVCGIPRVREDDAARGVRCAAELLAGSPLPVRVGVATGEAVSDGTAFPVGPVVEAAGFLRERAEPGAALVAERTCRLVVGAGFGDPTRLTRPGGALLWARSLVAAARQAAAPRRSGPFLGRDVPLRRLTELFAEVTATGRPLRVHVVGPAGIGKSRLVEEATAAMGIVSPGTSVLTGRCATAGHSPFAALGDIVRQACGVSPNDVPRTLRVKLRAVLDRAPAAGPADAAVDALALAAGAGAADSVLARLDTTAAVEEVRRAWVRFATACAAAGPAILVVEDTHCADEQLLEVLDLMAARAAGPLLLLTTARAGGGTPTITLSPLSTDASAALVATLDAGLAGPARARILARAEGNPFFLEELVLHAGAVDAVLPDTVQAVLAARMDALPAVQKRILQHAAVMGRVFWVEPVEQALGSPVDAHLHRLERGGFVTRRRVSSLPGQTEYRFRHALTQEVAYASIPRGRRARGHAAVGDWLERAGHRDDAMLANHFAIATGDELAWPDPADRERVRAKAFRHLMRAGDKTRRALGISRAIGLHERAQALASCDEEHLHAFEALGSDHEAAFQGELAERCYRAALGLAAAADRSRLCRKLAWLMASTPGAFRTSPDPAVVDTLIDEGLAASEDATGRAWLLVVRGMSARLWRGSEPFGQGIAPDPVSITERIASVEQAVTVGRTLGLTDLLVAADDTLTLLYSMAGRYRKAVELTANAVRRLDRARSALQQADVLRNAAVHAIMVDARFADGLALARRCHTLSVGTNPHQLMHATWPLLVALYHLGRWTEMDEILDEHLAALAEEPAIGCDFVRDGPVIGATVLAHRGDVAGAHALAARAGDPFADLATATAWQARFANAAGDPASARRISTGKAEQGRLYGPQHAQCLVEALTALADWPTLAAFLPTARGAVAGNALLAPVCDRAEGQLLAAAGRQREAEETLRRAVRGFEQLSVPYEAARTRGNDTGTPRAQTPHGTTTVQEVTP